MTTATVTKPSATLITGPPRRELVTSGDPYALYPVPQEERFRGKPELAEPDRDYIPAPDLRRIAAALIAKHPGLFRHLGEGQLQVAYRWKRSGGTSGGRATLGKCAKVSGAAKAFKEAADVAFLIWLAAEECRLGRRTAYQVEALLFHQLMHTAANDGKPATDPHDFEGFAKEVEIYGLWDEDLHRLGRAIQHLQLPLFALNGADGNGHGEPGGQEP